MDGRPDNASSPCGGGGGGLLGLDKLLLAVGVARVGEELVCWSSAGGAAAASSVAGGGGLAVGGVLGGVPSKEGRSDPRLAASLQDSGGEGKPWFFADA